VVAHDYLTQRGGAERVALALLAAFPKAPLVTSVYSPDRTFPGFRDHYVKTSVLQHLAPFRADPRFALPVLAPTWSHLQPPEAEVFVTSSSGWAHGLEATPGARKVVYCHNPARWLYQPTDYLGESRVRKALLGCVRRPLVTWDRAAAGSADRYLANSTSVAARIRAVYGIDAEVLPPPVSVDVDGPQEPVVGIEPGFLLTVARGRGYKNTHVIAEAVRAMRDERLVVVGGAEAQPGDSGDRVQHVGVVSDAQLRWLYANARALVSVSHEDFGLTPIEANAFGTPAVLLREGGFLDTLAEGVSGVFVEAPTPAAVVDAVRSLPDLDPAMVRKHADTFSPASFRARLHDIVRDVVGHPVSAKASDEALVKPGDRRRRETGSADGPWRRRRSDRLDPVRFPLQPVPASAVLRGA
jgi:glycosyltransferase involved in cell wall biosynthesis